MKSTSGYPQVFHVLPHEKAHLADEAIERIRAQDKYLRASLAREIPALMEQTKTMRRNELTVGRRYGVLGDFPVCQRSPGRQDMRAAWMSLSLSLDTRRGRDVLE